MCFEHLVRNCPNAVADRKNEISIFSFYKNKSEKSIKLKTKIDSGGFHLNLHDQTSHDHLQSMNNTHTMNNSQNMVNDTGIVYLKECFEEW